MPRKYLIEEPDDSLWDLNQERAFWERMLNQRINFFLAFFVILIIGVAVANTKELTLFILSVGAIILWVLTVSIINTTRKINYAVKELSKSTNHPTGIVDRKAKGRLTRLVLGFGLPIFCSSVITLIFLAGLSGLYTFNFPTKAQVVQSVQTAVEKGKESLIEKKNPVQENSNHFENVDSIIQKNKSVRVYVPIDSSNRFTAKQQVVVKKPVSGNPNFKSIDKVISSEEIYSRTNPLPAKTSKPDKSYQPQVSNPNFKSIDKVISDSQKSTASLPLKQKPQKEKPKPILKENPNFKKIEKVISEPDKD